MYIDLAIQITLEECVGISGPSDISITIRHIAPAGASEWEAMRCDLWPGSDDDHRAEVAAFFAGTLVEPEAVLVAETGQRRWVGFAELSIRTDLPGLEGRRVGYVEGLYVVPEFRNRGFARRLLEASRVWAREKTCDAFASDRAERIIVDRSF